MSHQAVTHVMALRGPRLGARLVLLAIAERADRHGCESWPTIDDLADRAGITQRAVYAAVEKLREQGVLKVERRLIKSRWRNVYSLPGMALSPEVSTGEVSSGEASTPEENDALPLKKTTPTPEENASRAYKEQPPEPSMQPSSSALARREQQPIEGIVINGQQPAPATAQTLLGEFLDNCRGGRPTPRFIGNLAARIKDQLVAGIEPDAVRGGLQILLAKGLHPAALDAAVHQAMNGGSVPMPNGIHPTATEQKLTRAADVAARFRERGE